MNEDVGQPKKPGIPVEPEISPNPGEKPLPEPKIPEITPEEPEPLPYHEPQEPEISPEEFPSEPPSES